MALITDFTPFPKISRLNRDIVVTEKIDGTNAQVFIQQWLNGPGDSERVDDSLCIFLDGQPPAYEFKAGSRSRWITPEQDNAGFARWAYANARDLVRILGEGQHFGEWWGSGIQRGYGLKEKRFSLFNASRWGWLTDQEERKAKNVPSQLHVVPVIYSGPWFRPQSMHSEGVCASSAPEWARRELQLTGSYASPGFMDPEGIVVFHTAGGVIFKATLKNDEKHKGEI